MTKEISLLGRLIKHAVSTAKYSIYYGEGKRDNYDTEAGRDFQLTKPYLLPTTVNSDAQTCTAGSFLVSPHGREVSLGLLPASAEELEFISILTNEELEPYGGKESLTNTFLKAAKSTADFFINNSAADGIPYWDTIWRAWSY